MKNHPHVRLADVSTLITKGTTPKTLGSAYSSQGIPFLRSEDVMGSSVNWRATKHFIDQTTHQLLRRSMLKAGDVLVTIAGTIGRVGYVPSNAPEMNCNQAVALIRLKQDVINHRYAMYALQSPLIAERLFQQRTTATIPNISLAQLSDAEVPLPPLNEQQRIVDILDRAASIQRLRQAADEKLKQIIPALFVDMFGDPVTNPKGWATDILAKLVKATSGGTPSKSRSDFWEGDMPWVSPKDMKKLEIDDAQDHISEKVFSETALKRIPASSVLIVVRGMILVHTVPVAIAKVDCAINQDMKALEPNAKLLPEFLFWTLRLLHETLLQSVSTAAHGTKKIDMAVIENLVIPVPPLELQRAFKEKAEKLLQMQNRSRELTDTALATAASLSSAAFS